ncbi:hypothetical protein AVEN_51924-1 [Araneus ventricosus]|uniref:Uncharacterized protein n=1 Tax=Araneus ventricosus TaxID=182803 RepID=A0A4Y2UG73_ARAVE|nr:hypothetical protein AVEN_51924-1 [Araneus ventricosus]
MKFVLYFQKLQEDDIQVWAINCQQRNEPLFASKIQTGARNRLNPASVELGGLRRDRDHGVILCSILYRTHSHLPIRLNFSKPKFTKLRVLITVIAKKSPRNSE